MTQANRVVSGSVQDDDHQLDTGLRPRRLKDYVGQDLLKSNLDIAVRAALQRNEPLDHTLLYGPPGLGKTTLANILATEMGTRLKTTSGPAIERPGDMVAILTQLREHDVLFIDEVHRLSRIVEEVLYPRHGRRFRVLGHRPRHEGALDEPHHQAVSHTPSSARRRGSEWSAPRSGTGSAPFTPAGLLRRRGHALHRRSVDAHHGDRGGG